MKSKIVDGLTPSKVEEALNDYLAGLEKAGKAVKFVTQSECTHGSSGNHHITVTVVHD